MQLLLLCAVLLHLSPRVHAGPGARCPARCDVSSCPSPLCPGGYAPDRCGCCLVCAQAEGEPCGRAHDPPCGDGLECRVPGSGPGPGAGAGVRVRVGVRVGVGSCRCRLRQPVCGSDGRTYSSACQLRAASREGTLQGHPALTQTQKGPCQASTGPSHAASPRYKFNFIADVVEKIAPAVVHIELFLRHPLFGRNIPLSSGSGFVMTDSGLILTNAHVVSSTTSVTGQQYLKVQMHNGDVYEASIKDIDKKSDIATIKINPQTKLPVLSLGHSADLRPGEFVVAIGSPFALQNTVTTGIISTAQRDGKELGLLDSDMDYIQTDAIINYGNSGGPLVNLDGEVIGINTLKVAAGISFAIPSDRITLFLQDSLDKHSKDLRSIKKRFIGIKMLSITPTLIEELKQQNPDFPNVTSGIYVHEVVPHSPAEKGGIRHGDIIVKLNGRPLLNTTDLQGALQEEATLLLEIRRDNDDLLFNIEPDIIMQ